MFNSLASRKALQLQHYGPLSRVVCSGGRVIPSSYCRVVRGAADVVEVLVEAAADAAFDDRPADAREGAAEGRWRASG
jgi:hypothetical protein